MLNARILEVHPHTTRVGTCPVLEISNVPQSIHVYRGRYYLVYTNTSKTVQETIILSYLVGDPCNEAMENIPLIDHLPLRNDDCPESIAILNYQGYIIPMNDFQVASRSSSYSCWTVGVAGNVRAAEGTGMARSGDGTARRHAPSTSGIMWLLVGF